MNAHQSYRSVFPAVDSPFLLTDGGLETTMVFHEGLDLPSFASFVLLDSEEGRAALETYYRGYAELAASQGVGIVLDTPTWRANRDWGRALGYGPRELEDVQHRAVELVARVRDARPTNAGEVPVLPPPLLIGGSIGPRADGYVPAERMSAREAALYHVPQVESLAATEADVLSVLTMNYVEEAIGIAQASAAADMPLLLSFTVETDGRLPTGTRLGEAIDAVDQATGGHPAFYMVNCAHPEHFEAELASGEPWLERIGGIRANASRCSHAELDEATELDDGNPAELGDQLAELGEALPNLQLFGGCCGTDLRHIRSIARSVWAHRR